MGKIHFPRDQQDETFKQVFETSLCGVEIHTFGEIITCKKCLKQMEKSADRIIQSLIEKRTRRG